MNIMSDGYSLAYCIFPLHLCSAYLCIHRLCATHMAYPHIATYSIRIVLYHSHILLLIPQAYTCGEIH